MYIRNVVVFVVFCTLCKLTLCLNETDKRSDDLKRGPKIQRDNRKRWSSSSSDHESPRVEVKRGYDYVYRKYNKLISFHNKIEQYIEGKLDEMTHIIANILRKIKSLFGHRRKQNLESTAFEATSLKSIPKELLPIIEDMTNITNNLTSDAQGEFIDTSFEEDHTTKEDASYESVVASAENSKNHIELRRLNLGVNKFVNVSSSDTSSDTSSSSVTNLARDTSMLLATIMRIQLKWYYALLSRIEKYKSLKRTINLNSLRLHALWLKQS